jgi:hypothetical protein
MHYATNKPGFGWTNAAVCIFAKRGAARLRQKDGALMNSGRAIGRKIDRDAPYPTLA